MYAVLLTPGCTEVQRYIHIPSMKVATFVCGRRCHYSEVAADVDGAFLLSVFCFFGLCNFSQLEPAFCVWKFRRWCQRTFSGGDDGGRNWV